MISQKPDTIHAFYLGPPPNLGFTEQARWEEDRDTLTRCVVRYRHFLDLIASTPGFFVVPMLIPDHDDKVSQGALFNGYDKTAEAWKKSQWKTPDRIYFLPRTKLSNKFTRQIIAALAIINPGEPNAAQAQLRRR
ncbi:hypothetical protein FRC05_010964 [Tulasnella sp. 425]|nr:hypothetical protein FRC05_010964 [Tulasnella sp. 425]